MKIELKENEERTTETALVPVDQPEEEKMDEVVSITLNFRLFCFRKKRGTLTLSKNLFDLKLRNWTSNIDKMKKRETEF